jgi:plastocyanin
MVNRISSVVLLVLLSTALVACGSSSKASTPATTNTTTATVASPPPVAAATITIKNVMYSAGITVHTGTRITVKNNDNQTHTLTSDDGSFDVGNIFAGASASFVAPKPGTYKYHCNFHASMHGVLTVIA